MSHQDDLCINKEEQKWQYFANPCFPATVAAVLSIRFAGRCPGLISFAFLLHPGH
jgi:hypothetical protein